MERTFFLYIFVIAGFGLAASKDLACCPPSSYILASNVSMCWEPEANTSSLTRLMCNRTYPFTKFSLKSEDLIEIKFGPLHKQTYKSDKVCTANLTNVNLTKFRDVAIMCIVDEEPDIIDDRIMGYCMIVSVILLGLTAIIYSIFSELKDLLGKSIINFCTSLSIGLGILAIMKLMAYSDMNACAVRGFLAYFFVLVAFFWANSISIQLLRDTRRVCTVDYGWREFRWYMLYSWGIPAILTMCMAIVNYHPGDHERPGIGLNHCWFLSKKQQWYYMYSLISILLAVNVGIFIYISTMVWRHSFSSSHINALKFKFTMTIRLIVLMGLPWIFEMISSLVETHLIWAIMDLLNTLQGIFIFLLLVVFRKRVIKAMHKRGWLDCMSGLVEKYLAVGDDAEDDVIQHTDVPLHDDHRISAKI